MADIELKNGLVKVMEVLRKQVYQIWTDQGHNQSGKNRFEYEIVEIPYGWKGVMYAPDHYRILEFGVKPARIPFSGTGGSGSKKSDYIEGLITYFERRGLDSKNATSAAFATAYTHKMKGMPSPGSYRFSRTGQRTGFVKAVLTDNLENFSKVLEKKYESRLILKYVDILKFDPIVLRA